MQKRCMLILFLLLFVSFSAAATSPAPDALVYQGEERMDLSSCKAKIHRHLNEKQIPPDQRVELERGTFRGAYGVSTVISGCSYRFVCDWRDYPCDTASKGKEACDETNVTPVVGLTAMCTNPPIKPSDWNKNN